MLTSEKRQPAVVCRVCGGDASVPLGCVVWGDTPLCYGPACAPAYLAALPRCGEAEAALRARGGNPDDEAQLGDAYRAFTRRWLVTARAARTKVAPLPTHTLAAVRATAARTGSDNGIPGGGQ